MSDKENKRIEQSKKEYDKENYRESGSPNGIPGINTPGVELPAFNPPVPNRAWTEMRKAMSFDNTVGNVINGELQSGLDDGIDGKIEDSDI